MNKTEKPLVSIGLLTYNQEKYIASSPEGLLSQEYDPIELIILDDASNDGTALIIEQYIKRLEKNLYGSVLKEIYKIAETYQKTVTLL